MEWNNNVNTEDWIIYSDDIVSFNSCRWQETFTKTIPIMSDFEYADT